MGGWVRGEVRAWASGDFETFYTNEWINEKNKFYNPFITFEKIHLLDKTVFNNFVTFIQLNYLKESDCYYNPSQEEIKAMFMDNHSYISLKTKKKGD